VMVAAPKLQYLRRSFESLTIELMAIVAARFTHRYRYFVRQR
jgi:hypothetical protein